MNQYLSIADIQSVDVDAASPEVVKMKHVWKVNQIQINLFVWRVPRINRINRRRRQICFNFRANCFF